MVGYRTYAVAMATFAAGMFARFGLNIDPQTLADTAILVIPAIMALMRTITRTPAGAKR